MATARELVAGSFARIASIGAFSLSNSGFDLCQPCVLWCASAEDRLARDDLCVRIDAAPSLATGR
jgi:hypothetical protein